MQKKPDLSILRPVLFWDTNMAHIDWERQSSAVIKRIFQRGNQKEKDEITRFYGKERSEKVIGTSIK
jgi:hypothetical protein